MLTKQTIVTNVYQLDYPGCKGTLTEAEAFELLESLAESMQERMIEIDEAIEAEDEAFKEAQ